jgi:hypothetical protein
MNPLKFDIMKTKEGFNFYLAKLNYKSIIL